MGTLAQATAYVGAIQPNTRSIAAEVYTQTKVAGASCHTIHGYRAGNEHGTGLALDYMVTEPYHASGQKIRDYLWLHRVRLRLRWVIWEQHITTYNSSISNNTGIPRKMEDRFSITQNHFDHPHAFFEAGIYIPKPPVFEVRTLSRGASGLDVLALQRGLNAAFDFEGAALLADGKFGAGTEADVKAYQVLKKLDDDGKVGPITRKSLTSTAGISL